MPGIIRGEEREGLIDWMVARLFWGA